MTTTTKTEINIQLREEIITFKKRNTENGNMGQAINHLYAVQMRQFGFPTPTKHWMDTAGLV